MWARGGATEPRAGGALLLRVHRQAGDRQETGKASDCSMAGSSLV